MTSSTLATKRRRMHSAGAPLLPPTIAYAVLTVLGVAVPSVAAGVRPWTSDAALLDFFQHHNGSAHASAFFTLGAAIPLAVFVAVSTSRLRTLGLDVPGRIIAQIGGTAAAAMLALAGVATLAATQPRVADSAASVRLLYGLTFAAGGPAYVVFSGLLLAGVSVSGLIGRVLPRAVAWFGLVIAVVCEVASLSAAFDGMDLLLAVGRFGGLVWMIAVGLTLPSTRRELRSRQGITRAVDEPSVPSPR
ncbi:MAG: hypothetical protein QOG01_2116 [Pseudonocardiales bacterium]|nr:hypothetical protein [Pseudonocardiales bacterium]